MYDFLHHIKKVIIHFISITKIIYYLPSSKKIANSLNSHDV